MSNLDAELINKTIRDIRNRRADGKSIEDVVSLAELSAESLQNFYRTLDSSIYKDIQSSVDHISDLKKEISRLKSSDSGSNRMARAIDDLREVVATTETATDNIMEQAEEILSLPLDVSNPAQYQNAVTNHVTSIFEACSFQDLTGQRIQRVISSLEKLEECVNQIHNIFNLKSGMNADFSIMTTESKSERRNRENLLHGPSSNGEGIGQSFVDAIFAIESKRTSSKI